jgi:hypothetical protein
MPVRSADSTWPERRLTRDDDGVHRGDRVPSTVTKVFADRDRPVLYHIVCGAPPAQEPPAVYEFVQDCQAIGWDVCVVPTRIGRRFIDTGALAKLTGHPLRDDYKYPHEDDVLPTPADAIIVAPATFNTVNKLAAGISDTVPLGLLNEAIGSGRIPVTLAVYTNKWLARHPVFPRSVDLLRSYGVRFVPDSEDTFEVATMPVKNPFPWGGLREVAAETYEAVKD